MVHFSRTTMQRFHCLCLASLCISSAAQAAPTGNTPAAMPYQVSEYKADRSEYAQLDAANESDIQSLEAKKAGAKSKWDVTAGAGIMVRPTYEGSDEYTVTPLPFISATYDDQVSIGVGGLEVYWRRDQFRFGGGLTYNNGREDSKEDGIFSTGDNRLRGLGDIDGAIGLKAFGSYDFGWANIGLTATQFTGNDNDGLILAAEASRKIPLSKQLMLRPYIGLTWADQNYTQTFFGVTPTQAANSNFNAYDADAGVKDISIGMDARYSFDQHWFISGRGDLKTFTGDVADSPLTMASTNGVVMTMVGYRF